MKSIAMQKIFIVLSSNMALLYVAGIYTLSLTRNPRFSFPVPDCKTLKANIT